MKSIKECFNESNNSITNYMLNKLEEGRINEGLFDFFSKAKRKFKDVIKTVSGLFLKVRGYFLTLSDDGQVLPMNSPLNAGAAYKNGAIDKSNTLVVLGPEESKIVGINTKIDQAYKLYGSGNSLQYWRQLIKESYENDEEMINEVKLTHDDISAVYNTIVDDDELKKLIKTHINNPNLARLLIWGAPGIGKTAILTAIVNEIKATSDKNYRCIVKTLSNETPDNFVLPAYADDVELVDDSDFDELAKKTNQPKSKISKILHALGKKATDIPKTWLPVYKPTNDRVLDAYMDEKCGSGLLFIDELSRATDQVLNVILPLINEGNINGYRLGSKWTIIAASNRMEDEQGSSQSKIGNALANRFAQVYYEPTVKTWRKWADTQGYMSPLLLDWLSLESAQSSGKESNLVGAKYFYFDPNEGSGDNPDSTLMCTPRSWTNAMRALAVFSHTGSLEGFTIMDIDEVILKRTLNQYVPAEAVDSFWAFLKVMMDLSSSGTNLDEVLTSVWKTGQPKLKIRNMGLVALSLAHLVVNAHGAATPTAQEFDKLCDWLVLNESDQLTALVLSAFEQAYFPMKAIERSSSPAENIGKLFIMHHQKVMMDPNALNHKISVNAYNSMLNTIGHTVESWPDYYNGFVKLGKAYGQLFKNMKVDGKEVF